MRAKPLTLTEAYDILRLAWENATGDRLDSEEIDDFGDPLDMLKQLTDTDPDDIERAIYTVANGIDDNDAVGCGGCVPGGFCSCAPQL